ncbi:MAG: ribosomal protein S18-alanine N-acetyltransferase [Candidatus Acidiferrum sp.]
MAGSNSGGRGSPDVRSFRAADADAVIAISKDSPESANWSKESYLKMAEESGALALVIETEGMVTAFFAGRRIADQAEVFNLAVKQGHRRKGEASALMSAALEEFGLQSVRSVYLEVRESNTGAIAFYERHGFAKTGRRKGYYQEPDEAAVTMKKELTG